MNSILIVLSVITSICIDNGTALASPCQEVECKNDGRCFVTKVGMVCECPIQWGGNTCELYLGFDGPCRNVKCETPQGICVVQSHSAAAQCVCLPGHTGIHCERKDPCWFQCHHHGTASCVELVSDGAECVCKSGYGGPDCGMTLAEAAQAEERVRRVWTGVAVALCLTLLALALVAALLVLYRRRGGKPFSHSRLQDNVEITNPMYLQGGPEDDTDMIERTINAEIDKNGGSHFANPVYESMYSHPGTPGSPSMTGTPQTCQSNEERANLLRHAQEAGQEEVSHTPPPPAAERAALL